MTSANAVFLLLASRVNATSGAPPTVPHTVTTGETLWELASPLTPPGGDVRVVISEIKQLNGLGHSGINAGQKLLLPAR